MDFIMPSSIYSPSLITFTAVNVPATAPVSTPVPAPGTNTNLSTPSSPSPMSSHTSPQSRSPTLPTHPLHLSPPSPNPLKVASSAYTALTNNTRRAELALRELKIRIRQLPKHAVNPRTNRRRKGKLGADLWTRSWMLTGVRNRLRQHEGEARRRVEEVSAEVKTQREWEAKDVIEQMAEAGREEEEEEEEEERKRQQEEEKKKKNEEKEEHKMKKERKRQEKQEKKERKQRQRQEEKEEKEKDAKRARTGSNVTFDDEMDVDVNRKLSDALARLHLMVDRREVAENCVEGRCCGEE